MHSWPAAVLLFVTSSARAQGLADVVLTDMTEHDGVAVLDRELLGRSYRQLVMELGTLVANKPVTPAETLGMHGFDIDIGTQFVLTEARDREGEPSPWARANPGEDNAPYLTAPTFSVRKGLPLSSEVGGHVGWIAGSQTGLFGGWARLAILEGYKPIPDVSVKIGYSGYVGNDELDLGAMDFGVTLGTTWGVGQIPGVNTGQISPWLNFTTLRVSANATIDDDVANAIGALRYTPNPDDSLDTAPPIALPRFGAGMQFVSGNAHVRIALSWAPATIPAISSGVGFTF